MHKCLCVKYLTNYTLNGRLNVISEKHNVSDVIRDNGGQAPIFLGGRVYIVCKLLCIVIHNIGPLLFVFRYGWFCNFVMALEFFWLN